MGRTWAEVAAEQHSMISHTQLRSCKVTKDFVAAQVRARRWVRRTRNVVSTTTGPLSVEQRQWLAVLHPGGPAVIGGLTAAFLHGLRNWERDDVTVLVDNELSFEPVSGVTFFRTRRALVPLTDASSALPRARLEPAILLFAAHERYHRTALGAVTACVQQGLTRPELLRPWIRTMRPLRRAADLRALLDDLDGGVQSVAELDAVRACRDMGLQAPRSQTRRRGRDGRWRYTDLEWDLPGGQVLVLEVDGGVHLDSRQYTQDVQRQRSLTEPGRLIVRCTAYELRHEPWLVIADLKALGVPLAA